MELGLLVGGIITSSCAFFVILNFTCKSNRLKDETYPPMAKNLATVELPGFKHSLDVAE